MTDNERIAKYVMGWTRKESEAYWDAWLNKDGEVECETIDWHPDTDLEQAMMVAEAMRKRNWYVELFLNPDSYKWEKFLCMATRYQTKEHPKIHIDGNGDRLETAIHAAAVQVARAMEVHHAE